ncbi:hypothetical protein D3C76_1018840 [compost metagenome]
MFEVFEGQLGPVFARRQHLPGAVAQQRVELGHQLFAEVAVVTEVSALAAQHDQQVAQVVGHLLVVLRNDPVSHGQGRQGAVIGKAVAGEPLQHRLGQLADVGAVFHQPGHQRR